MTPHDAIQTMLTPLAGVDDIGAAVDFIGDAELALLGEASPGRHEFYASRANITRQLVPESGFRVVVVEADWPDAYRVNRYVRNESHDKSALEALDDFKRFATWMWRNVDVVAFVEGELNVGQLMRERFSAKTALVGYTAAHGTVTAAKDWGDEHLFHEVSRPWTLREVPETYPTGV